MCQYLCRYDVWHDSVLYTRHCVATIAKFLSSHQRACRSTRPRVPCPPKYYIEMTSMVHHVIIIISTTSEHTVMRASDHQHVRPFTGAFQKLSLKVWNLFQHGRALFSFSVSAVLSMYALSYYIAIACLEISHRGHSTLGPSCCDWFASQSCRLTLVFVLPSPLFESRGARTYRKCM